MAADSGRRIDRSTNEPTDEPTGRAEDRPEVPAWLSAGRSALSRAATEDRFSLAASIGGVRGVVESVLPYTIFSVVYALTDDLQTSIVAALVPVGVLVVWRLVARETLVQAFSGAVSILIGAWLAQRTGEAANLFLPSILKNGAYALAYTISILVRWPLVGVVVGPLTGEMFAWRQQPARRAVYRRATWIWVGLFGVRLAVQLPLYLTKQVALLGTLNGLVLGLPLFGLTLWLTWLVLRPILPSRAAHPPSRRTPDPAPAGADQGVSSD